MGFTRNRRLFYVLSCLVATLLLLAAACGDDDDSDDIDDVAATATDSESSETDTDDEEDEEETDATPEDDEEEDETDDAGDGGGVSDVGACDLLTEDEVSEAIGVDAVATVFADTEAFRSCQYASTTGGVNVTVTTGSAAEALVDAPGTEDWEEVDGLGESARWSGEPLNAISVFENGALMDVAIYGTLEIDHREAAEELAETALSRLQP
jgi:hypothetical protein